MADDEKIQGEKYQRFIDALTALLLATMRTWEGEFRDCLDSAVQVATEAVYRDSEKDQRIIEEAERVVAKMEFWIHFKKGGKIQ